MEMGTTGAIILGFFGAVFAAMALVWPLGLPIATGLAPLLVFVLLLIAACVVARRPGAALGLSPQAERVVMWSSIAEGIGIFVGIDIVINLGHRDWMLPVIALVVGLHFLPIARATASRAFGTLAIALLVAAVAGFALPQPAGATLAGFAAAASLWTAATLAIAREARFRRA